MKVMGRDGQEDLDLLFKAIVLSKLTCGLSIYGASNTELNIIEHFLLRWQKTVKKRRYISHELSIYDVLEKPGRKLFSKISKDELHPLYSILPTTKDSSYSLRRKILQLP